VGPYAPFALWAWLFVVLGLTISVLGPALPGMRGDFGTSLSEAGLVFALHSAGYLGGVFLAGPLADARGRKTATGAGAAGLAGAMALAAAAPSWPLLLGSMVLAGIAFALLDISLNVAIADAVPGAGRRAAAMNLLHGGFSVGTLAAPAGLAFLWSQGLGWRSALAATAAATAISLAGFLGPGGKWPGASERGREVTAGRPPAIGGAAAVLRRLREPAIRRLAAIQGLYVGVEIGIAGWLTTYLVEEFGAAEGVGALSTTVYWTGFLAGRPLAAYLTHRFGPSAVLPWLCLSAVLAAAAGVAAPTSLLAAAAFAATGVAISGVFPTVLTLAQEGHPGDVAASTAVITGAAALGALTWPLLAGGVAQAAGLRAAMAVTVAPLVLMTLLARGQPS
jgi:fucose permease